ncbi:MAG: hypothetical protein UT32_C0001G0042 [Parcubacteria group bacterium GW2011_GWC2_39_14]|nr:MAG: hypothetical protein UT32_C0001G0042 [Parcubacteria group bacterium GW2011_GWC2_39_14]KKR55466.1 MAG: hypothetical protein UT91_C0001G0041 [Parcubacteria group bacterium GW2011_GWA2_40_23]
MLIDKWTKIFSLVKKTGDKVIIFDEKGIDTLVVMPFDQYERLISQSTQVKGLTEDEMLDRINQDIARWQATQKETQPVVENLEKESVSDDKDEEDERYYVEPLE